MARVHGNDARVYVNEFNLSGRSNRWELDIALPKPEVTAFEDVAQVFLPVAKNQRGWTASIGSWQDYLTGEIDEVLQALVSAGPDDHLGLYVDGAAAGSRGYEGIGVLGRLPINAPHDGPQRVDLTMRGVAGQLIGRAMKLDEATAITTTSAQTGQNHMAAANGDLIISVARITAVDGAGSVTVRLEESTDNASVDPYGTVLTHDAMTAVGSQHKTVTAASMPGPWFRTIITAFSTFTSVTLRHAVAIVPGG